jgi:hypothetical protein
MFDVFISPYVIIKGFSCAKRMILDRLEMDAGALVTEHVDEDINRRICGTSRCKRGCLGREGCRQ